MTHAQAVESGAAERYLLDEMSELERHAFENHYFACPECAEDVRAGGMMRAGVRAGLLQEGVRPAAAVVAIGQAGRERRPEASRGPLVGRLAPVVPWALAATLAIAVGYQGLVLAPQRLAPQGLSPVTLRPATRGAEPVVPLPSTGGGVALAVELSAGPAAELAYDLRSASDRSVASGRLEAPPPGSPLFLLVPAWTLEPSEHYILTIRRAGTNDLIDEFRFGVAAR